MSRELYLSPIIGNGTGENPWRVAASEFPGVKEHSALIPANMDGSPQNTHAICMIDMDDQTALRADPSHIAYRRDIAAAT